MKTEWTRAEWAKEMDIGVPRVGQLLAAGRVEHFWRRGRIIITTSPKKFMAQREAYLASLGMKLVRPNGFDSGLKSPPQRQAATKGISAGLRRTEIPFVNYRSRPVAGNR